MSSVSHAKHRQIREIGEIRVRIKQRKIHVKKIFGLLLPFGQWAYGESRGQKNNSWSKKICVLRQ